MIYRYRSALSEFNASLVNNNIGDPQIAFDDPVNVATSERDGARRLTVTSASADHVVMNVSANGSPQLIS